GNEQEVVTEGQVGEGVEEVARVHGAGRVGGSVDEEGAGARRDGGGDGGGGGEVAALGIGGNGHGHAAGPGDLAHEGGGARVGADDRAAGVERHHEGQHQGLHGPHGDEALGGRVH